MNAYITRSGQALDLAHLTPVERHFLARCVAAFREGMPWLDFGRLVDGIENPLLQQTGGRVTRDVWQHPLYQAISDMEDRLGIAQGELQSESMDSTSHDALAGINESSPR